MATLRTQQITERALPILRSFVTHRNAANLLMLLMVLFGLYGISQLNRQLFPTIETRNVSISLTWSGASAQDIERNMLEVIEPSVRFLDGVIGMSSNAREGGGSIRLEFERNTDMQVAEDQVQAAVDALTNLPQSAEDPEVSRAKFFDPVASIGIAGPFPEATLRDFARELRDGLLDEGVDKVSFTGYRDREITLTVDQAKLRQLGLTLDGLSAVLSPNLQDRPSGSLNGDFEAQIRASAREISVSQIESTPIKALSSGETLTFGDVAAVIEGYDENTALGFMRGEPAIKLTVSRSAAADTVESYDKIKSFVETYRETLPPTVQIEIFDAAAELVNDRLRLLISNGATGLALVLIILFIFLDFRVALWVAVGIPVSIFATLGFMALTGQTINMISLFALLMTLGIIVDDAIVVGEHTATLYARGYNRSQAAMMGAQRMLIPVFAASLTTIAAFGPILLIGDALGQILSALPMVVIAVLIASLIECFLVLPGHLAHSLPQHQRPRSAFRRGFENGFNFFRERIFTPLCALSFRWRYATVALAIALSILSAGLISSGRLGFSFFPSAEADEFNVFVAFQPGTPQDEMINIISDIEGAVAGIETELAAPDEKLVLTTYASLGSDASGTSLDVYLTPSEERSVRTPQITQAVREALPLIPGVERINVREARTGPGGRAIDIQLSGADAPTLKSASEDVQAVLEGFTGVTSISDTLSYGSPELVLELTPRGEALGFSLSTLGSQIRDAFEGRDIATIAADNDEISIKLIMNAAASGSDALRDLWVQSSAGSFVPISSVVSISERQVFSRILREEGQSVVNVRADVEDGVANASEVIAQLEADYLPAIQSKYAISYDLAGEQQDQASAFADLRLGALLALGVMYIIIAWTFESYFAPLAVMLIIPFGIVGSIWGHYFLGYDLTIISFMGLLGLAGILVNDSIVLISRLRERQFAGESLRDASVGASADRLRAVLLTSLTTIGGLIPLLFEQSLQAQFLIPMAITIIFGLGLATLLVLFLVPALLAIGNDIGAAVRWLFLTPNAPTLKQLFAGWHHDQPSAQKRDDLNDPTLISPAKIAE